MHTVLYGKKYLWQLPTSDRKKAVELSAIYNVSPSITQTLLTRGLESKEEIDRFLFSSFEEDVTHPRELKDADKAVKRIIRAVDNKEKILVFGDYDVDGITSSSLVLMSLIPLGASINFYLPHRVKDGYGLSTKVVERAAQNGYKLIITVDNGITAFDPVERANELGVDVIITDHHKAHDALPQAYAIVNPNQPDCAYPHKNLAGVGVIFKVLSLLYEYKKQQLPEKVYELLLLGTIADVVPLVGENRFWVRYGLSGINKQSSYSFKVLVGNSQLKKPMISATDIGFSVTPQINALGRLEDPRDGVKFLIGTNKQETDRIGSVLYELNEARKDIERTIFNQVQEKIEKKEIDLEKENIIMAASDKWPAGVIGLVASRLVSAHGKPVLLFHLTKQGIAKGSCRSIAEFNIFDALHDAKDLLSTFGGHAHAAGLALPIDALASLKQKLEDRVAAELTPYDLQQKVVLDAAVSLADLDKKFMRDMQHLEPFGHHNRQPAFYIEHVVLMQKPMLLKDVHVKCVVFADGVTKSLIFFNRPDIFEFLMQRDKKPFAIAAHVTENHWRNNVSIELTGIDIACKEY